MGAVAAGTATILGTGTVGGRTDDAISDTLETTHGTAAIAIRDGSTSGIGLAGGHEDDGTADLVVEDLNPDGVFEYRHAFGFTLQRTDDSDNALEVWFELRDATEPQYVYASADPNRRTDAPRRTETIRAGETTSFGVHLDTHGLTAGTSRSYTLRIHPQ